MRALLAALLCAFALLATSPATAQVDHPAIAADIAAQGDALLAGYDPAVGGDTAHAFSSIYFDVFEGSGMEAAIGAADPDRKSELESLFGTVIGLASEGAPPEQVAAAWENLKARLATTAEKMAAAGGGALAVFVQSFLIMLREGVEAILVVAALAAYLRRSGAADQLKVVWRGVALALVASLATAWLLTAVLKVSGAVAETVEGVTMLIAAAVLAYVSHWLFAKREAARWQAYIKEQVGRAVSGGRVFSLGVAAFLAVYREGAETVLFYQALVAGAPGQEMGALGGFILGAVALVGVYAVLRNASMRLPLGLFFGGTAVLLYALAITFAGQGILELQGAGLVPTTPLAWAPRLPWLGLFPTLETMAAQGVLLALLLPVVLAWLKGRGKAA